MKKYLILLFGLIGSTIVLVSFSQPAKDDNERSIKAGVNLVDAGKYRLAIQALKDCDEPFADALRMEAYNGLNRKKKAIRYGMEYLDALGRQNVNDSTISVNSYVTVDVADILDKNWKRLSPEKATEPSEAPSACIDYIAVLRNGADCDVRRSKVCRRLRHGNTRTASDHLPVLVELIVSK